MPLPVEGKFGIAQSLPKMVLGKGVHFPGTEVSRQHRAAETNHITLRQQTTLNGRKIAVSTQQQRVLLLTGRQRLPVNVCQQTACAVAAAYRHHNSIRRF